MRSMAWAVVLATGCALPENPEITQEIHWADARTEELARRACYDCHSHETVWKGGHRTPIVNSLVRSDVRRGRCHMNFSTWDQPNEEAWDAPEALLEGEMPLGIYLTTHKEARLTDEEVAWLAEGLEATFLLDPPRDGEACEDDD